MKARLELQTAGNMQRLAVVIPREGLKPRFVSVDIEMDTHAQIRALSALTNWLLKQHDG